MADKKDPSAPKSRVKPGTPSKLLKGKVFGYHGKYVWKATFDAQTKARNAAKQGSALARRTSTSIVRATRATLAKAPKGKIIPINKTDSAVVKAAKRAYNAGNRTRSIVNKIYQAGKTTRKNVETVYKAGKEARKVHDKVVKGGKEVVKGAYEGGKDTKRAVNRLRPGGKIVKSKGGAVTKYRKSKTGKLTKYTDKGSELTKYEKGGKLANTPKTPPKKTPTKPKNLNARQLRKVHLQNKTVKTDTPFNRRWNVKGSKTNPYWDPKSVEKSKQKSLPSEIKKTTNKTTTKKASKTKSTSKFGKNILNTKGGISNSKAKQVSRILIRSAGNLPGKNKKGQIGPLWRLLNKGVKGVKGIKTDSKVLKAIAPSVKKNVKWLALLDAPSAVKGTIGLGKDLENARRLLMKGKKAKLVGPLITGKDKDGKGGIRWDTADASSETTKISDELYKRHKSNREKLLAKEDAKKRSEEKKVKETKTVNNNKKVTIKNVTKGNKPKTYWNANNVPQYDGKSSTTKTKETESNKAKVLNKLQAKKKPDPVGNMKGAIPSKPKKKYTARDRMRAENEKIHGKDRNDRVYEYNKAWQKARKEGKLREFKKKYPSVRSWKLPKK